MTSRSPEFPGVPSPAMHKVTIGTVTVAVRADEDLLTALLRHGVRIAYGCRHGNCGRCRHVLADGEVAQADSSPYALSPSDRATGAILLCRSYPLSDLTLTSTDGDLLVRDLPIIPPADRGARVVAVENITSEFAELSLRLDEPLTFRPGQYMELAAGGTGEWRSFSPTTTLSVLPTVTFLVERRPNGRFSSHLDSFEPGDRVDVRGPFGSMSLADLGRPVLMVANGSGIAPVIAMLRDAAERDFRQPVTVVYGLVSASTDAQPFSDELRDLGSHLPQLRFLPCPPAGPDARPASTRDILRCVAFSVPDPSGMDAFVCGAADLCDATIDLLEAKGLPAARVSSERFYPGDIPPVSLV